MRRLLWAGLALALSGQLAWAEGYHCVFVPTGSKLMVPRIVDIKIIPEGALAQVSDDVVRRNYGDFVLAKVTADSAQRRSFSWVLIGMKDDPAAQLYMSSPSFQYFVTVYKADGTARLRASLLQANSPANFEAAGRCTKRP
jgi:hypothetical protein